MIFKHVQITQTTVGNRLKIIVGQLRTSSRLVSRIIIICHRHDIFQPVRTTDLENKVSFFMKR